MVAAWLLGICFGCMVFELVLTPPKAKRDWEPDVEVVSTFVPVGSQLRVTGVRNCHYRSSNDFDVRYEERTLDLHALSSVDFMVERFHPFKGIAHTLLSFGFDDGQHICVSVEIRRERGESYHPLAGLYRQYELVYVVGTEQDLIGLRTNHRKSDVWLYPIRTTRERMRLLFVDMLTRAAALGIQPEYYHTLTNNCTTNMVDHVLELAPKRIPFDWRILLPGFAGELAHELGLIDTDLPLQEAMNHYRIDELARTATSMDASFSRHIRSRR